MSMNNEKINIALKEHQENTQDWDYTVLVKDLHEWEERFILQFKLQCPMSALRIGQLRFSCHGDFQDGRNEFGLLNEICLNEKHINGKTVDFDVLGTLLHELIHSEQQALGTNGKAKVNYSYHNNAFIQRAEDFGLVVDHQGQQEYAQPPTQFSELLARHGIEMPKSIDSQPIRNESPHSMLGNSKLKLWVCSCNPPVRVRVAIADFQARCLKCVQIFIKA